MNNDWDLTECILLEYGLKIKKPEIVETFQDIYLGNDFNGLIQNEKWLLNKRILVEINRSYKTGIVTGRPKDEALFVLYRFGMEDFFSVVVTMDDIPCGRGKPDPLGIKRALEKLECDEAFYIGDTVDDMMAAQRAKIVPIGIYNECGDKTEQSDLLLKYGAVSILDDVNNILEVLNGQEGKY